MLKKTVFLAISLILALSACAPQAQASEAMPDESTELNMEKPTEEMMVETTAVMMDKATVTPDGMMDDPEDAMMEAPAWFGTQLTNVSTGENFTINDFKGKVVLVESLAMWCPTCKKQQEFVRDLHETLGMNNDLVSIGLDIDTNENASDLKAYIENNGFDWIYTIAPAEVAREIGRLYGNQFLNPPSTPILIIDRKGGVHPMPFGLKSVDDLKTFVEPFLAENL